MNPIVVLSGTIASGKSTLSTNLVEQFGFQLVKTNVLLQKLGEGKIDLERISLQEYGQSLDEATGGDWIRQEVEKLVDGDTLSLHLPTVLDAVRIEGQIEALRTAFANRVVHVHLKAPDEVLARRFKNRRKKKSFREAQSFEETQKNPTEIAVRKLEDIADIVVNTDRSFDSDVLTRVASHLGLYGREPERLVDVLIGGQYGSEGKGHIASYLAPEYDILVRVGGPNAGHKVFHPPYTFHHLPSGTFHSEARLILGPGAVLNLRTPKGKERPKGLIDEIAECKIEVERLTIDPHAMIIEAEDINNESLLEAAIASTKSGVGYATARRIINRQNYPGVLSEIDRKPTKKGAKLETVPVRLAKDIKELRPYVRSSYEELERAYAQKKRIMLEGTQGTALSIFHGHYPHVTSRDTTVAGCLAEAGISANRVRKVVMVCRTYPIRVGDAPGTGKTSGYMSQPISLREIAKRSRIPYAELKKTERTSTTNRERRIAEFDWALLRRSATLNAPTDIALSFSDYIDINNRNARRFEQLTRDTINFVEEVEKVAACAVSLISTRFHTRSIIDRRTW